MKRPDHEHFWLMAAVVQDLDAAADDKIEMSRIIGDIDLDSLGYMAAQRAMRVVGTGLSPLSAPLGGAWVDGFMTGVNFQKRRAQKASDNGG